MTTRAENLARLRAARTEIAPGQKYVVDHFRPEDALGVAQLYYATYGEGFAADAVYDPEGFVRNAAAGDLHMVVGRTERGDIVGIYSLFRHPPGRRIMEAGGWAVHSAYRNTTLAMRLTRLLHTYPPDNYGLDVIFGQSVCDHVITQKMSAKYDSRPSALEIDAMPPRPEDSETGRRVTLLDSSIILRDAPHAIHLPQRHAAFVRDLSAAIGLQREMLPDGEPAQTSRFFVNCMEPASFARMHVQAVGRDFADALAHLEQAYGRCRIRQITLNLDQPGVSHAVETAREAGYFLGGLLPLWDDRDALLLQKIPAAPDFAAIQLNADAAKRILELVAADHASLPASER